MKLDEELWPDREDAFQTDDEENRAEVSFNGDDDDSDSVHTPPSRISSELTDSPWPQSYRESMNMFSSPTFSFVRIPSWRESGKPTCQLDVDPESAFSKPLISEGSVDFIEEMPTSTIPSISDIVSQRGLSICESLAPQQQCSFAQAVLNGINVLFGLGLLTTPYAIREGGWLSLILLFMFFISCCYTGILLKRCIQSSPGLQTYPDIGQAAFGKIGRVIISITLYVELYGACVEYLIMMSDNLSMMFPNVYMHLAGMSFDAHKIFSFIATLTILPTVWLRDLSLLSYLSVGGVGASILVVLCLLWVGVVDRVGFHAGGTALDLANLSVSVGIYGFCYSGHSVFPNIYSSMKEPTQFPLVLIVSFLFCWFMYTAVAICGYLIFGDSVESQFTLNMPTQLVASKIAVWTTIVCPMTKYALTITPVALSLEELLPSSLFRSRSASILIRTILVTSTLVTAITVPFFGNLMALMGSLLAMLITLIFPCACYLSIHRGRLTKFDIATCMFTMIIGAVSASAGTYSAIRRIAGQMS
ncbi:hypothetical protein SLA2020_131530 [Shorea laevis]